MNRRIAILAILICLVDMSVAHAGLLPDRVAKAAQKRIDAGVYRTLVFAVVDGNKSEIVTFGQLPNGKAPDGDTVYEIGSITKTFTATLLADAVLSGHVTLETPLAQLLPDFKIPTRGDKEITLVDIATQHSGLPRMPGNLPPDEESLPRGNYDVSKLKAFLASYVLPRDPGAAYEYSNLGYGLLALALGRSAHTDYGNLLEHKIFIPLGKKLSGSALTNNMRVHLAPGYGEDGKPAKSWDMNEFDGAGAIRSTAADMLLYMKANMGPASSPLVRAMKFAQVPRSDMDASNRIGLAWMKLSTDQGEFLWHNGGTFGYASFLCFSADGRHGVVVLANTFADVDDLGFATLLTAAPLAPAFKAVTLPSASLEDYVGTYKLAENFLLRIFRDGDQLLAQATGQGAFPIFPSAPNEFFAKVGGISISFTRDAKGTVSGLVLHQNGDRAAPKTTAAELPAEPKEIALDAATLQSYVGKFQFAPNFVFDITLTGNQLFAQLTGQSALPVYASTKDQFFYKVVDAQLSFERDAKGNVVAVVLHQNGRDMRAPRIAP
jgi:CubicO group peptidase (beta-lactamase class C family)